MVCSTILNGCNLYKTDCQTDSVEDILSRDSVGQKLGTVFGRRDIKARILYSKRQKQSFQIQNKLDIIELGLIQKDSVNRNNEIRHVSNPDKMEEDEKWLKDFLERINV